MRTEPCGTGSCLLFIAGLFVLCFSAYSGEGTSLSPDSALSRLKAGNARYVNNISAAEQDAATLRLSLAIHGQQPIAAVIACADSRVPVEMIFQQQLGDLFVIRAAGNTAGVQTLGSVQYGVEHLGLPLVVVLGHTRCGAVGAVVKGEAADGSLAKMLEPIQGVAMAVSAVCGVEGADAERIVTKVNVTAAMRALVENVGELANRVVLGKTKIVGAVYDIESGVVEWLK